MDTYEWLRGIETRKPEVSGFSISREVRLGKSLVEEGTNTAPPGGLAQEIPS